MDDYHDYDVDIIQRPKRKEAMPNAPERHIQDPNDFLMGGGVPSASFLKLGASVSGTVCDPPPSLQQQRDYTTNEPKVWDDGNPMMHMVVTLQTDENDAKIEDDDGRRRIYVKNNMKRAVADAVRKAKSKALEVGGHLTVTYTGDGDPSKKGQQPPKVYSAIYAPPGESFLNDSRNGEADSHAAEWAWSDYLRYANDRGVTEANLKAAMKRANLSKLNEQSRIFVITLCAQASANAPLADDDIPF